MLECINRDEELNQSLSISDVNKIQEDEIYRYKMLVENPKNSFRICKL